MTAPANSGFWGSVDSALGRALEVWGQVEAVKAKKASTGQLQNEQANTTELDNGAAVLVDAPKTTAQPPQRQEPMIFGIKQSHLLMGSVGLLGFALIIKAVK
ncbi:hypothetical protein [Pseudoalteromonas piscicida]|uniref:Uncharacterized protein n=1 Tax=Pseudoalteromonas piscicida TaxID=43662 RepID=A0AAD0RPI4_PSEO7|nr:hypothetical protein [Pseudoalteromonas piscicida]ASD67035.1 hypothetical protein B1L02_08360 [Pseudoalteromonas piscicida]AXR02258.1 hypothetical protein D0511_09410 [Pseudoalteromonas piscicida]